MIRPFLASTHSLADLGCGAGLVDLLLARELDDITCVDKSPEPLRFIEREAAAQGLVNIRTLEADANTLEGCWDTVLMMFFGRVQNNLHHYLSLCVQNLIAVVHADVQGKLGPAEYHPPKCNSVSTVTDALDAMGARYTLIEDAIEYGQPFATREEAEAFVRAYSKNPPDTSVAAYLDERLQETSHPDFPLYLPNLKPFGILIIRRDENAHI